MFLKKSFLIAVFFIWSDFLIAQPGDPGGGVDPDQDVPISGLGYLLALGAFLGAKKIFDARKKK